MLLYRCMVDNSEEDEPFVIKRGGREIVTIFPFMTEYARLRRLIYGESEEWPQPDPVMEEMDAREGNENDDRDDHHPTMHAPRRRCKRRRIDSDDDDDDNDCGVQIVKEVVIII